MKDKIPEFLQEKINQPKPRISLFPDEIKQFIMDYAYFYRWSNKLNIKTIFKLIQRGITEFPICELDGCNNHKSVIHRDELSKGCCKQHSMQISNLKLYGVKNPASLKEVKEKIKKTNILKYGHENAASSEIVKKKIKKTNMMKYGVENPSLSKEICEKRKNTFLKKYGVTTNLKTEGTKIKTKMTNLSKYGVDHPMKASEIAEKVSNKLKNKTKDKKAETENKRMNTNMKKYGVAYPMQDPIFFNNIMKKSYMYKKYIWKTGEISLIQGNEDILLNELEEKGYTFNDIKTDVTDMPLIEYIFKGKKHKYYPDLYIPTENLIIEVKSQWTLDAQKDKNNAKFEATKSLGFNFKLEIR